MNKEFFRGMKEQIEPDEEQVEELKNKLKNTAAVSRKPMWIGGVCAAALCVAVGAGLFLSDSKTDKNSIKTSGSSSVQYNDSWSPDLINRNGNGSDGNQTVAGGETEDSIADSTHDSKIDNSKTDDTHNTNNNTGGNTHITDNDRISDNNGGIISDNSNTENTDSNANDSKSETTSSKNETEDPIEFDEKDPVYPEIYVQDERLFDMTLKGRAFEFPAKYSDVADMGLWAAGLSGYSESVDPKNYVIAEDDMETFFSNGATGYSGSMTIDNNTYEEAKASDCDVMGLFLDNCPEFSIGGIKTGSTIEEVNKTFGVNYTNECRTLTVHSQNGAFTDSKGTFTLTVVFAFDDGVVYSVGESKIYSTFF